MMFLRNLFEKKMAEDNNNNNVDEDQTEEVVVNRMEEDKEKQSKIMAIVNSYDAKIVVEKQILEKLKEQKKFLLSNMFI